MLARMCPPSPPPGPADAPAPALPDRARQSEERFRLLVESVQDYAIFMLDVEGRVVTWNIGARRLKGYRADEIIGRSFETFYPPDAVAAGWPQHELRSAVAQGRFEDEGWRLRKDGMRFWASVVITALRESDGTLRGFAKVTRDLTASRAHEEALRQSEEQFRLLVESVRDYAIFMLDPTGRVLTWNAGAAAINGYAAADVLHRDFSIFFTPEDIAAGRPQQELAAALRDGRFETEGWRVRQDGSLFWASAIVTPMRAPDGTLRGFAKVTRDMSQERRLVELEHGSQRMQEFIAMLAHELRNPLAPVRNASSVLRRQPDMPPTALRMCDIIDRQMGQLTRLVDDLLDVGRIVTGKIALTFAPIDFSEVVHTSLETVRQPMLARRQTLDLQLPGPLPMLGDATRLAQSLQNLLNNAVRYTPVGGHITVSVQTEGSKLVASVADNGSGIAHEALERIFELFHQEPSAERSPSESGLGIGLNLARALVEQHGGRLTAHSDGPGRGSCFVMQLPMRQSTPEPPAADTPAAGGGSTGSVARRVLVVDDNRDSTDSMVTVLGLMGHQAEGAYSADEALARAEHFRPDLVLLDLNMPGDDGYAAIKRLRTLCGNGLFVAAMTGYGQASDREATARAGFQAHLTKPIDATQIEALLRQAQD
jgi:PAS domain S-box-containing protein